MQFKHSGKEWSSFKLLPFDPPGDCIGFAQTCLSVPNVPPSRQVSDGHLLQTVSRDFPLFGYFSAAMVCHFYYKTVIIDMPDYPRKAWKPLHLTWKVLTVTFQKLNVRENKYYANIWKWWEGRRLFSVIDGLLTIWFSSLESEFCSKVKEEGLAWNTISVLSLQVKYRRCDFLVWKQR